jgi:hypothetical protein
MQNRQTQVDRAGVECIDGGVEFHAQGLLCIQWTRHGDQVLGEVGVDLPRPGGVRVGQRIARNRLTPKAHVVKPSSLRTQVDLDVAQRLAVSQLRKRHGEELIQAREVFDFVLAPVFGHTTAKRTQRQVQHELRKYELALVHGGFWRKPAKSHQSDFRRSNRDQTETPISASKSLTYKALM